MSSYLYFQNNLKDIKDQIYDYIISCKFFLQQKVEVSKESMKL